MLWKLKGSLVVNCKRQNILLSLHNIFVESENLRFIFLTEYDFHLFVLLATPSNSPCRDQWFTDYWRLLEDSIPA